MARSMQPIHGVTNLDEYNPEAFDAKLEADGTYTLTPVRWMNQEEFNAIEFGGDPPGYDDEHDPMETYYDRNPEGDYFPGCRAASNG